MPVAARSVTLAAVGLATALLSGVNYASAAGTWHPAIEAPGTATLNQGGNAQIATLSCKSPGNCTAGGSYVDSSGRMEAFVVSEVNGTWKPALEVPGTAALNAAGLAQVDSVSCVSAGNCIAGGSYRDTRSNYQAFLVAEVAGAWHFAFEIPGTASLNQGGGSGAGLISFSCPSQGNCAGGGSYSDTSANRQAFVVNEVNGVWEHAIPVPGIKQLNATEAGNAQVSSVSCASASNCAAVGYYTDESGALQAFVTNEVNGVWGKAAEIPGTAGLNKGGAAQADSVSCPSAGNCGAGGSYMSDASHSQDFVVSEVNGVWRNAIQIPGSATLNKRGVVQFGSVSCTSAGNCGAGGGYTDAAGHGQAFVVSEVNGTWRNALEVPGSAGLNQGGSAEINSVSCTSSGTCSAGGGYLDSGARNQALVVSEVNGTWQTAAEVPGSGALNTGGNAQVNSISCASATNCGAGGFYAKFTNVAFLDEAFVASRS